MYLALWLIKRWRLPTAPCLILPVAVSLKRFLTPLFVLSLGILVSLGSDTSNPPWQPLQPGRLSNPCRLKRAPIVGGDAKSKRNRFSPCRRRIGWLRARP